jgi:Flp pilus assembly protein protease CpaA
MPVPPDVMRLLLLVPMAVFIIYFDVRYRRIPNLLVLGLLIGGLTINISFGGFSGALTSLDGLALAFLPMF